MLTQKVVWKNQKMAVDFGVYFFYNFTTGHFLNYVMADCYFLTLIDMVAHWSAGIS